MADIVIHPLNESFIVLDCNEAISKELRDYYTFYADGYKFSPKFRAKIWDGKVRIIDKKNRCGRGLAKNIKTYAETKGYSVEWIDDDDDEFSVKEMEDYIETLGLPFPPRDYQADVFLKSIRKRRNLIVSATSSGKSMMIYLILKYLYDKSYCKNLLVIVPTTSLVVQLTSDLSSYGLDTDSLVHCVYDGAARKTSKPITISTFQALANEDRKFFQKWDAVFLDEAHQGKAASITYEINACVNAKYRFGFTGTLNESKIHHLILEGLFAAPYKAAQAHELIAAKTIAPLEIKALALKYEKAEAALVSKMSYQEEIDFLCSHPQRNAFIVNLALSLKTNTLVLFQYVEKHGQPLFDMISQSAKKGRKVFYVYGGTETDERDQIRKIVETEKDAIIVASAGVFATGINIKNLHNVIFAHAGKSKIRTLQSIGRSLRAHPDKEKATLFDISDNLKYRNRDNFSLKHLYHRLRYYTDEKFPFKVYNIELKKKDIE